MSEGNEKSEKEKSEKVKEYDKQIKRSLIIAAIGAAILIVLRLLQ